VSHADRIASVLGDRELDLLLIIHPANLRWATGYSGSNGLALIGPEARVFLTDFRYVEQAAAQVPGFERHLAERDLLENLSGHVGGDGALRLGFDDAHTSVRTHARIREALDDRIELVAAGGLVEELRAVKDPEELDHIRTAARVADEALERVLEGGLEGRTEHDVAVALEHEMRLGGAEEVAFPSIVAAGEHGARPHAEPRPVAISRGELVTIDWGAAVGGYRSDCTRTYAVGEVSEEAREVYELVREAQAAALGEVGPGRGGRELDAVARGIIEAAGHGEHFGHPLGHGVGLDVHEDPRLSKRSEAELEPGNVVTVEPGVYIPGRLGVRIEDLVAVTADGHEVFSSLPKELRIVG
jgi:Xaa-Pro aminopeptidase